MNVLTCVYCGMAYPEGTPPHGSTVLTEHIKICEKHPMREAELKIAKLRKALLDLTGVEPGDDLAKFEAAVRMTPGVERDKIAAINAIHALQETA